MRFAADMKKFLLFLLLACAALCLCAASAEPAVTFVPESPRMGDYVDVTVTPGRDGATGVTYTLRVDGEPVFTEGKPVKQFTASFRPRQEGHYTLEVTVSYGKKDTETVTVDIPVSGQAPAQMGPDVVYSQRDGWWKDKIYNKKHHRSLQKAGCAIFTLSHALQRIGVDPELCQPETLAAAYSRFYVEERGTNNEGLILAAGKDFDFNTSGDVITGEKEVVSCLRRGDLLSVGHVLGHIALLNGVSEDGKYVHVVDSALSATYERLASRKANIGHIYYRNEDGSFTEAVTPDQLPGLRWFFETQEYGGAEYWMTSDYIGKKDMRLIRPHWLFADLGNGPAGVSVEYAGAMVTKVERDGQALRVETRNLKLADGSAPRVALVTGKKGTKLTDSNGKALSGVSRCEYGSMILLLASQDGSLYGYKNGSFGYVKAEDVEVLAPAAEGFRTGMISVNGKTSGSTEITAHKNPKASSVAVTKWKPGTPVAVVEESEEFLLLEGKGYRGWVHQKYFTPDQPE